MKIKFIKINSSKTNFTNSKLNTLGELPQTAEVGEDGCHQRPKREGAQCKGVSKV